MRKFLVSIVLLCCISSLQAESLIYSTSFTEWSSQTYTGQQMMRYSGIDFTVCYVKIDPNSKPTSVSSYEGTGYLQPSNGSNLSSCYFQTGKLSYVSRVSYTQAAGTIGCGWRLESSNDGVYFYPFNENETGCTSMKTPETKEVAVYMSDVWLRWTPITTGSTTTNIYLMDINIYGDNGEGGMGGNDSQPVVSIAGSMNEWSMSESTFTPNEDGLSAGISMYLAAGSYEFKIVLNNSIWRSLNGDNGDLYTFHRDWTTASNITEETASNFKLNADVDGEYKFTWTYSDNSLSIVFPEQTGMGDIQTYYLIGNSSELGAWDIANALPMDGGLITVNLPAGSYAIKVLDESKNWDTAMGYLNVNNSCSSSGIAMDEDKNAVFVLEESGSVTVSASDRQICLNGAFKVPDVGQYTNFAALVNHDSTYNCYYAGKATNNYSQYKAQVRLSEGDTLRIINRADGNSVMQAELDSYGLVNNFVSGDFNRYHVCVVGGCYDVYYSYENLYIGTGGECPTGAVYTGEVLPTGWIQLRIKDGQYGNGHVSIDGEGADSYEGKSGIYVLGMELNFEAQPTSSYQFLQWSDNNYANPRPFVVTGDTIIYADFGSLDHYPTGILLNHKKFIRSTYNDGTQLIVRANIQDGDTVELYFLNDNIYWMAELEPYGKYESFSGGAEQGHLICHETGCYDIYFKLQEGITQTIYIGEGTQCFDGVDWTAPAEPDYVYSLVGTANLFGEAWVTQDTTTEMKLQGENMYTYTIDSIALYPDSSYQYKVISNHEWNVKEYPNFEENYSLSVEEPGVYQVLFQLNLDAGCSATTNYIHAIVESSACIEPIASGICGIMGDNVTWSLSCDSVLTISGTGEMADYKTALLVPFGNNYNQKIKSVIVAEGVTTIGKNAFNGCSNIMSIEIPNSVTSLGDSICNSCTSLASIELPDNITSIPIAAFLGCSSLANVKLPNNLTQISTCAFKECTNLVSMEIPNSVTSLRGSVFNGCSNLTSVNLPSDIAIVPSSIFYNCTNLISIEIPDGVTSIETTAFYGCNSLPSVEIPNSVTEIGISAFEKCSSLTNITIPNSVLTIKAAAFRYCSNLETISLPDNLQSIQSSMFTECTNLQSVQIPNDVKSIGNSAFDNCSSLTSIDIPEGVLSIGANAFFGCIGITSLEIPDSVISIGNSAFRGCYNLETITVGTANTIYDSRDGCNAIIETSSGKLIAGCMNTSIPISVKSIGEGAFENYSTLKSIIIPDSVTNIGNSAFLFCSGLESITCKPTTPPTIGSTTFDAGKRSIPVYVPAESIDLYKTTTNWNAFKNIQAIPCEYIASGICGIMGDNVTWSLSCDSVLTISGTGEMENYTYQHTDEIPWYTYRPSIHSVIVSEGVSNIGDFAFYGCSTLTTVSIPNSVTSIGTDAFNGCALTSIEIPEGVTSIGEEAFTECHNLMTIDISSSVNYMGAEAFSYCPNVSSITCRSITPPSTTGFGAFLQIDESIPVYVPAASVDLYKNATVWSNFTNIQAIPCEYIASGICGIMGDNVTWSISCDNVLTISGTGAMEEYSGSSSVPWHDYSDMIHKAVITEGVTSLSSSTFENCTTLVSVTIPEGITELGMYTFANCSSLKAVDLPSTITSIGSYCFSECWYIDSIICRATTPPVANGSSLSGVNYMIPIYVPAGTTDQYMDAEGWSGFTDYRAIDGGSQACTIASGSCGADGNNLMWVLTCDSVLTIYGEGEMPSSYASNATPWYEYGQSIKHINIEEGVTKLALNSFYNSGASANYPNVRTLSIPSTLGAPIETNFFYGCQLKTVIINSDTIVGKASYSSNSSLQNKFGAQVEEYIIGGGVRSIANFAFYNQSPDSLCSIYLPEGLEAIGNWAFGYIDHLTSVTVPSTVQTIGTDAFAGCSKLHNVELGEGLLTVNGQAFWMCDNLTQVTCYAMNPPTLNSTSFDHYDTLIVRCEAKSLYQEADYWKNFTPILCPDDTTGSYVEPDAPEQITFALDSSWQFIMLPTVFGLEQDDIIVDGGEIEWGTYNSEQRAAGLSGWQGFVPSSGFSASRSYIIRARNGSATLTIKVPEQAREKAGAAIPFAYNESAHQQNANWNFLGNPYPYSFNIMDALDAQGITSPIAVWNGIGYIMYTPGIDVKILDPFEAFFIQMPTNGTEVLQYSPDYIVGDNGGTNSGYNSAVDEYGALSGYFTINSSKEKVQFSRGNLQYNAAKDMWQFAENQYEIIGEGNANISSAYDGWIDLFGWGTGNNPTKTSTSNCDYSSFVDWGTNAISNGGNTADMWRTLSANEWTYITGQRTNCDSLCGRATVNGIQGFILLPDDWVSPGIPFQGRQNQGYELNQYSLEDWQKMEAAGAVFLPACGGRSGTEYSGGGLQYWSTNAGTSCYAYDIITGGASDYKLKTNEIGRQGGYGVRLVK